MDTEELHPWLFLHFCVHAHTCAPTHSHTQTFVLIALYSAQYILNITCTYNQYKSEWGILPILRMKSLKRRLHFDSLP